MRPPAEPLEVIALTILVVKVYAEVRLKVAVQLMSALTVIVPSLQSAFPDQPAKKEPAAATGARVTTVFLT
jgi:hypothetical protein